MRLPSPVRRPVPTVVRSLAVAALAIASVHVAIAGCPGSDPVFWGPATTTQVVSNPDWCGAGGCYFAYDAPLPTAFSPEMRATFWLLGQGDPAPGAGVDAGGLPRVAWVTAAYSYGNHDDEGLYGPYDGQLYAYAMYMQSQGWNGGTYPGGNALIDGCISDSNNTGPRCLCVLFDDEIGDLGYFAVLGGVVDEVTGNALVPTGGLVQLQPMPRPYVTGSVRMGEGALITARVLEDVSAGVQGDACGCAPTGFRIYRQIDPLGAFLPGDRTIATGGWVLAATASALDEEVAFEIDCTGEDSQAFLAASLVVADGFETGVVGRNGTRIACGPNLAEPDPRTLRERPVLRERGGR